MPHAIKTALNSTPRVIILLYSSPAARRDALKRDGMPIAPRLLDPRLGTETETMNPPDRPTSGDRFDHPVRVEDADIDANGHANNVAYLRWVQEAAVAHWSAVVEPGATANLSWVVVRHEIDYERPAYRDDALIA